MRILTSRKPTSFALAAVAFAGMGLAIEARAAQPETGSAVVRYSDLDLKTDAGVATLQHRVAGAAERICGPADSHALADADVAGACRAKVVKDYSAKLDSVVAMARGTTRTAMTSNEMPAVRAQ